MKRIRNSVYSLLLVMSLLASLVVFSSTASAASAYDSSYQSTASLYSSWSWPNCSPVEVTLDWSSYLLDETKWPPGADWSAARASLQSALNNEVDGAWGATQFSTSIAQVAQFYWTEDPAARLEWSSDGVDVVTNGPNIYVADIACSHKFYGTGKPDPVVISAVSGSSFKVSTSITWSSFYTQRSLFVHGFNLNYVAGYEGESVKTGQPQAKYVPMGDSYSGGGGNPSFEAGTDNNGVNECHRSPQAYPRLLQGSLNLGSTAFVACAGAKTENITNGQWNEPAQIDALSEETEVVTITIGGNDVKFGEFAKKCVSPLSTIALDEACDEYTPIYNEVTGLIANSLPAKLEGVYTTILDKAPNAEIYVGGYPIIAPFKYIGDPFDQDCGGLYDEYPNTWGDARAAYEVVNLLNVAIEDAVNTANSQESTTRLHYVDVSNGAFAGHDICESDSYFNGIDAVNPEYSLHPNGNGQIAYAEDFEGVIS